MPRPTVRHQSHVVVNRNRRARAQANQAVNLSTPYNEERPVFELEGRLTLVQQRDIEWKVRVEHVERDVPDLESLRDPVNQTGPVHSACVPIVTSNDAVSYLAAVNKRSNFIQNGVDDDLSDEMCAHAAKVIDALPSLFDTWDENEFDRERWLRKFDMSKRQRMEAAWESCDRMTLSELRKKNGSVKIETLVGKRFDKTAAGRIIYAGTDVFNAVTGPAMMVAMERLCALLDHEQDGERLKVGGILEILLGYKKDDKELASFIKDERFREIVEGDFSRNDREQRKRVATEITDRWFRVLGFPSWFRQLMLDLEVYSLTNRDFGVKVHLMYQLATGTTNTTFRNSTYNITMFVVTCQLQNRRGKALVLGDDLLAALNKRLNLTDWVKTVADFKMVLKAKSPTLDGHATFLSRRFFTEVEEPFMLPLIGKMLVRFNTRACQNEQLSDAAAMAAKSLSYAFGCKSVHHFRDMFLERYELEMAKCGDEGLEMDVDSLGWNVRQNGWDIEDIKRITKDAANLVDDDTLSQWLTDVYDIDLFDTLEIFRDTVVSDELVVLEDCRIESFRIDYD